MIILDNVRTAAARIAPHVRRTPLVSARALKDNPYPDGELLLKLECLAVVGFDFHLGFHHQPKDARPDLALDRSSAI